jgi:predicted ATPase/Tfp pilus assembly protein PilF
VRDQLPAETGLRDLGAHRLKDLQQPEHVFGLLHPGLPTDFPPLRSLEAFAHNLPSQLTSFIGREQQMAEVKQFLATTRLLTLTGSGGCGKTRLALQVAADLLEEYADGVWLVELAPLTDPALVPQTVASALGAREEPGRSLTATLTDTLRPKSLLMVLDNCEHLLTACAQLADTLLRSCPGLRMLASSREGLGIGGEQIYRVPSLSLPDATHLPPLEGLHEFEAVQLFADRARLGQPAFAVTQANALAVAQVCQRLDGIPLAIELAAARVKVLSVEQIAERLDDRFRLLTGGSRTALPRQQTLRALIDWSYDLLVEPERALLRRSSVFAGGWSLEAAEAVCAGDGIEEWEVLDLLTSLVDKSLASAEEHEGLARYRLLETVRQYARDRLLESGEEAGVRRRHLECFLRLAEEAISWLAGPKQAAWLDRLETEHDNLRAGLEWSRAADERVETGLRLALALWAFWDTRHHRAEAREHLSGLLERSGSLPPAMRAAALCAVAHYTDKQHDSRSARQMVEEGLAIYRRLEDKPGIARALRRLGVIALRQGDAASARTLLEESLDLHRELNKKRMPGWLLWNLGEVSWTEGDTASAQTRFEQSLSAFRANGDKLGIANALQSLGAMAMSRGEYAAARPLFEESLENGEELGSKGTVAESLQALGDLARCQGDWEEARSRYTQSLAIGRELENAWSIARSLIGLGLVLVRLGQYAEARAAARDSMRFWQAQGNKRSITRCLECLAQVAWAQGELVRMARLFGAAEAMREAIPFALHPGNRSEYDGITAARAALGEEAFAAAWAEGRALSLEAAIALALEERGDDPPFDRD